MLDMVLLMLYSGSRAMDGLWKSLVTQALFMVFRCSAMARSRVIILSLVVAYRSHVLFMVYMYYAMAQNLQ